jgi:hypothetical protein
LTDDDVERVRVAEMDIPLAVWTGVIPAPSSGGDDGTRLLTALFQIPTGRWDPIHVEGWPLKLGTGDDVARTRADAYAAIERVLIDEYGFGRVEGYDGVGDLFIRPRGSMADFLDLPGRKVWPAA